MSNKNKKSEDANTSESLILNSENISTSLNDMLSQEQNSNNKILDMSETETETERKMIPNNLINKKNIKETQSLKENKIKNKIKSSSVIQIPQSIMALRDIGMQQAQRHIWAPGHLMQRPVCCRQVVVTRK